jgi:hypothetical protein
MLIGLQPLLHALQSIIPYVVLRRYIDSAIDISLNKVQIGNSIAKFRFIWPEYLLTFVCIRTFAKIIPFLYPLTVFFLKSSAYLELNSCIDYWIVFYGNGTLTYMSVTIDGVWICNRIYWIL